MSLYNFLPSINKIKFVESQTSNDNLSNINSFENVFELAVDLEIGGLNFIKNPVKENESIPFFLNIVTYTQRGNRDAVVHGFYNREYTKEILDSGISYDRISIMLNKFRKDEKPFVKYDFISSIFFVKIFVSTEEITTSAALDDYLFSNAYGYYELFKTKIPMVVDETYHFLEGNNLYE